MLGDGFGVRALRARPGAAVVEEAAGSPGVSARSAELDPCHLWGLVEDARKETVVGPTPDDRGRLVVFVDGRPAASQYGFAQPRLRVRPDHHPGFVHHGVLSLSGWPVYARSSARTISAKEIAPGSGVPSEASPCVRERPRRATNSAVASAAFSAATTAVRQALAG